MESRRIFLLLFGSLPYRHRRIDKMERLIKSETVTSPTDKEKKVRYNNGSNLFVGRLLQEE
jgi:hypothetical protein